MEHSKIRPKLYSTLLKVGLRNPFDWCEYIDILLEKLTFLNELHRYDKLLKNILSSAERNEFNSYAFEASFAYDFEMNRHELIYEFSKITRNKTSLDFYWRMQDREIYFELRVINQRSLISTLINSMLKRLGSYEITLGGEDEQNETVRLQNLILSKCQYEDGRPIKFNREEGSYNFIVVFVSALHLGMIDRHDCMLTMYGDSGVANIFRRGVFGLCEQLQEGASEEIRGYHNKFKHFRDTIHGVLFVRNVDRRGDPNYLVNLELQYYLIANNNLLNEEEFEGIREVLSFLSPWAGQ